MYTQEDKRPCDCEALFFSKDLYLWLLSGSTGSKSKFLKGRLKYLEINLLFRVRSGQVQEYEQVIESNNISVGHWF